MICARFSALPIGGERADPSCGYQRQRLADFAVSALEEAGRAAEVIPLCEREAEQNGSYLRLVERLLEAGRARVGPPVPPGLGRLNPALHAFVDFFEIDANLVAAAAEASPALEIADEPLDLWVALLPVAERNAFLVRVARGEAHVGIDLLRRLRKVGGVASAAPATSAPRRIFTALKAAAQQRQRATPSSATVAARSFSARRKGRISGAYAPGKTAGPSSTCAAMRSTATCSRTSTTIFG